MLLTTLKQKTLTSNTAVLTDKPLLLCQKPNMRTVIYVLVFVKHNLEVYRTNDIINLYIL